MGSQFTRSAIIVAWMWAVVGSIVCLVGLGLGARSIILGLGTIRTQGTVVGMEYELGSRGGYHPVVRYTVAGVNYQCKGTIGSGMSKYKRGEKLGVLYRASDPSVGYVDTFFDRWLFPLMFGGGGGFFAVMGYFMVYATLMPDESPSKPKKMDDFE